MELARKDLAQVWAALDHSDAMAVRQVMLAAMPDIVSTYGSAAATLAADYFDELRDVSGMVGGFTAMAAEVQPVAGIEASTRWGIGSLFGASPDPAAALSALGGVIDRLVKQAGRDTIDQSVAADPRRPTYARVPGGKEPCAFCLMLASRGPVYGSKKAAGDGNSYHADCGCIPTPVWTVHDMDRLKETHGYDPDKLYEQYLDIHDPGIGAKQTTAAWRSQYGGN